MMKMNRNLNAKKTVCKVMTVILILSMLFSFVGCNEDSGATITNATTTTSPPVSTTTTVAEVAVVVTDEQGVTVTDTNGSTLTSIIPASNVTTRVDVVTESNGATRTEVQTMATFTTSVKTTKTTSTNVATTVTTSIKKPTTKKTAVTTKATAKVTTKTTTKATTRTTTTKTTVRTTTKATTKAPTTTTTQAHKCTWTKIDYKSPAVGVNGYYKYVCHGCGDTWTKDLPGFSYGTATPAEVQAYANQYLAAKGCKINTSVSPWNTPCGYNSPMLWGDGDSLNFLIPYIELHIDTALAMYGVDQDCVNEPVTAYAEVPTVKECVTYYSAGTMYICFY